MSRARTPAKREEDRQRLLDRLRTGRPATIRELKEETGWTDYLVRKELLALEKAGKVARIGEIPGLTKASILWGAIHGA